VLLPWAADVAAADAAAHERLGTELFAAIVDEVPEAWLPAGGDATAAHLRTGYVHYLTERLRHSSMFAEEATRVRAELV